MAVTDLIPRIHRRKPLLRGTSSATNPLVVFHDEMNRLTLPKSETAMQRAKRIPVKVS